MATVFALVDGVLFKPLPYPDAHDVFAVSGTFDGEPVPERLVGMISPRELSAWRQAQPDLRVTLVGYSSIVLEDGRFARAVTIDRNFFDVFGVRLLAGGLTNEDFVAGEPVRPLVISYALWQTHFNGDPQVIGRVFTPHGFRTMPYRIAGVLDRDGFVPPLPGSADSWIRRKSKIDVLVPNMLPPTFGERIGVGFARVPAAQAPAAEAALRSAVVSYRLTVPRPSRPYQSDGQRRAMAPYDDVTFVSVAGLVTARQRPILTIVFATASGLTLLVLLNAGALAAARSQQRLRELAVRRSLGARPRDLLRSALVEQGLLAAGGAAIGLALAPSLLRLVERALPPGLELIKALRIDWRAAAFVIAISAVMTLATALMTVRYVARNAPLNPLMATGAAGGRAGTRFGRTLVAAQIALGFVLVLGGTLFVRSIALVWQEDPGLRVENAAVLRVALSDFVDRTRYQQVVEGVRSIPGVAGAAAFNAPLFQNFAGDAGGFRSPDGGPPPQPAPSLVRVGSGFFTATGMTLLAGRLPSDPELDSGAPVIAVSETLATRYWPGEDPIGRTLRYGKTEHRVVGVLRDARIVAMDVEPAGTIFAPLSSRAAGMDLFLAFSEPPDTVLGQIVARMPEIDPIARVSEAKMVEDAAAESVQPRTISAIAASGFAIGALVLVAVGLFGLAAQTTGWRTREIGIRLALGDTPAGIVALIATGHGVTVVAGLLIGSLLAAAVVRVISAYLYGVTAYDPGTWAVAAAVVIVAAAAGALVPALRAGAVSPVEALRAE
jgi:predicted permease